MRFTHTTELKAFADVDLCYSFRRNLYVYWVLVFPSRIQPASEGFRPSQLPD
jgi:hypothetical protein